MSNISDIELAADAALAAHELKHGALDEGQRLAFQVGFADGMMHGLEVGKACVETQMTIEKARG